ncbi:hypothetical protein OUZ56_012259 [Daphnia magna]|uniref:Uncharacterized protein n=2 Tax=Opisthokonta TaxID=33154 RepID=A0A098VSQ6_9MICR|nr:hypothetical protein OUZ56_012247 [Daphnia magna]KAK4007096.1 hypothetical protein OUZ56_012256 [Daphnia magna]KAK4007098.1 hypothetical protein OUZ56_012259 [Daphnia magna]KGG52123.1 hypothetical protein DI09_207p10 [Mitosporidium daphniae]|eukprot:XP_013238559.1 uncharacterized protein DI09_207p10 [Mitosporidium daphniae]
MADEQKEQTTIAKRRKSPGNQAVARTLPGTVEGQYNSLVIRLNGSNIILYVKLVIAVHYPFESINST